MITMLATTQHRPGYQTRDYNIVDYEMYPLDETALWFRGPKPRKLEPHSYFTCIGAAQTLGCLCDAPFPTLLQSQLNLPTLNLGYGGAGPSFFLRNQPLIDYINRSKFVIIQVMSGRSESNAFFDSGGLEYLTRRSDGTKVGAEVAYQELLEGRGFWTTMPGHRYSRWLAKRIRKPYVKKVIAETRQNWISNYRQLLDKIWVPKILLWFSVRKPAYTEKYNHVGALFNKFPQLVNAWMVDEIAKACDSYVECVTNRGIPQPLSDRFTGLPTTIDPTLDRQDLGGRLWTQNIYYPSPQMHEDAAASLINDCKVLMY